MSSLLQHHGARDATGSRAEILVYLATRSKHGTLTEYAELDPGGRNPVLYRIYRRPAGMWGCWVLWRVNGETLPLDLSTPTALARLPRDARPVGQEYADAYWKS